MYKRAVTVLVGAIVVAALAVGVAGAPVPYVVLEPGPTWDTLGEQSGEGSEPVIDIDGVEVLDPSGEMHLTTVSVRLDVTMAQAVAAWFARDRAVVPLELLFPSDRTREDVEERNVAQFTQSQSTAEAAALSHLNYPTRVTVVRVVEGAPADGALRAGDVITSVDGAEVTSVAEVPDLVTGQPAGTAFTIGYLRDGQEGTVEVTTAAAADGTARLGVEITAEADAPFTLDIALDRIGGPSAGLMFALGIINLLGPEEDLTGGRVIAGTGTIDPAGNVGAIGGVAQKLVAADRLGADAFLVPAGNCADAVATGPPGLPLIRVETLADALAGLAALQAGERPASC